MRSNMFQLINLYAIPFVHSAVVPPFCASSGVWGVSRASRVHNVQIIMEGSRQLRERSHMYRGTHQ